MTVRKFLRASFVVRFGRRSPAIPLDGAREVSKVEIWYQKANFEAKPEVGLFGRRRRESKSYSTKIASEFSSDLRQARVTTQRERVGWQEKHAW